MAKFCMKCGNALGEEDVFCLACGQKYVAAEAVPVQAAAPAQSFCPPPPPPFSKPVIPGRGAGIASMVLGIINIVYSFGLFYAMYLVWYMEDKASMTKSMRSNVNEVIWEVLAPWFIALFILVVLGTVFAAVSKAKGYRNAVSNTGMALNFPSLALWIVAGIFLLA